MAYANDYHSLRGNSSWAGSDGVKQQAIIKATDYIEQTFARRWTGNSTVNSLLSWPRYGAPYYNSNIIPEGLKKATAELALEALTGQLNPNIAPNQIVKREKVDIIDTEYVTSGPQYIVRPAVTGLLAGLLTGSAFNIPVVRV